MAEYNQMAAKPGWVYPVCLVLATNALFTSTLLRVPCDIPDDVVRSHIFQSTQVIEYAHKGDKHGSAYIIRCCYTFHDIADYTFPSNIFSLHRLWKYAHKDEKHGSAYIIRYYYTFHIIPDYTFRSYIFSLFVPLVIKL